MLKREVIFIQLLVIRYVEKLTRLSLYLSGISLVLMTTLIFIEIIGRTFLGVSTLVADEMTGYFNVALAFFGLAYTFKTDGFIRISILYDRLPMKWKKPINVINTLGAITFSLILLYYFWGTVKQSYLGKATSVYISRTPLYIPQLVLVIGIIILILQMFIKVVKIFKNSYKSRV